MRSITLLLLLTFVAILLVSRSNSAPATAPSTAPAKIEKVVKTDAEWKKLLSAEQYRILREKGTEPPFRNAYFDNHKPGAYICAGCALELFSSECKFDSGTGWPSFYEKFAEANVISSPDADGSRNEVLCARCDGHLGHVFNDGPRDKTGLRYCINSGALKFVEAK